MLDAFYAASRYILDRVQIYSRSILDMFQICSRYVRSRLDADQIYSRCIPDTFQTHPRYILNTFITVVPLSTERRQCTMRQQIQKYVKRILDIFQIYSIHIPDISQTRSRSYILVHPRRTLDISQIHSRRIVGTFRACAKCALDAFQIS